MTKSLVPIQQIAAKLNLPERYFEALGSYGGKIKLELLADPAFKRRGNLILVTATTPTVSGEGKTVTSIGLAQGIERGVGNSRTNWHSGCECRGRSICASRPRRGNGRS